MINRDLGGGGGLLGFNGSGGHLQTMHTSVKFVTDAHAWAASRADSHVHGQTATRIPGPPHSHGAPPQAFGLKTKHRKATTSSRPKPGVASSCMRLRRAISEARANSTKNRVRDKTPQNAPRTRPDVEKKDQKAELKKNQTRRRYVKKTSIFFQTTGRHPPGARRETTEVKTRKC